MSATAVEQPVEIDFKPTTAVARRFTSIAISVPMLGAAFAIVVVIVIAAQRIFYPYELDWLETGMLEHVRRLIDGQPLYTSPSYTFTQFPYAPASFGVGALFSEVFGVHLWVMRSISFVSFLGTLTLITWIVRHETKNFVSGFIAAGVYAGTYKLGGTWFDIGKADDLFLFATIGAIALARRAETTKAGIIAGFVMASAVLTKQTAVFVFVPLAVYLVATRRRAGIAFLLSGLGVVGATTLVLDVVSHGWFNYYVWELLFQHPLITTSKFDFVRADLKPFWPVIPLVLLATPWMVRKDRRWSTAFYVIALGGLIAGAWSSRLHEGGAQNVLLPAFAAAAVALGISLGTLIETPRRLMLVLIAVVLASSQLWFVRYDFGAQVPTTHDRATGDQFISWLRTIPGDVLIYSHPTYAVMAGKASFVSEGGSEDVLRGKDEHAKAVFERSMAEAIHQKRFSAIILDSKIDTRGFPPDFLSYYEKLPGSAITDRSAFLPIAIPTGHPQDVYEPIGSNNVPLPLPGPDL